MALALPELPEDIQRRILLSLPPKTFARSCVLSKSWLSFYNSTRCSFNFNFHYDPSKVHEGLSQIAKFAKSLSASLLREQLTVDEFNINMELDKDHNISFTAQLTNLVHKWLAALFTTNNLVIVKVLRIQISSWAASIMFHMPSEIFSNGSLQVLHLKNVHSIYPGIQNLGCLRVLSLQNIGSESTGRLLTACPILEQLTLSTDLERQHIIIHGSKLKNVDICVDQDLKMVKINAPNLRCYEYECNYELFSRQLMMKTGMLEMVVINLMHIEIDQPHRYMPELRKALRMIEQLKLGVDTVKLDKGEHVSVKASRLDENLNVSATRVIEMLDAGGAMFDVVGKLCF